MSRRPCPPTGGPDIPLLQALQLLPEPPQLCPGPGGCAAGWREQSHPVCPLVHCGQDEVPGGLGGAGGGGVGVQLDAECRLSLRTHR
eukprot:scaffold4821_cov91-Isochrysis_galbana.AAC.3